MNLFDNINLQAVADDFAKASKILKVYLDQTTIEKSSHNEFSILHFIKQTLKIIYKTNVFVLLQPSSGFYNLAILINFKFTHTHKKTTTAKNNVYF